jgi:Tol biopolymer transport system component
MGRTKTISRPLPNRSILVILAVLSLSLLRIGCGKKDPDEAGFMGRYAYRLTTDGGCDPTWSPDGEAIVYVDMGGLWLVDLSGGTPVRIGPTDIACDNPHFLPHLGQRIITYTTAGGDTSSVWSLDLNNSDPPRKLVDLPTSISSLCWYRSGGKIAFTSPDQNGILVYDTDWRTTSLLRRDDGWENPVLFAAASPTDDFLYFIEAGDDYRLFSIDSRGGTAEEIGVLGGLGFDGPPAFHSLDPSWDGTTLAVTAGNAEHVPESWALYTLPTLGGLAVQLTDPGIVPDCREPSWSPDGTRIAFCCQGQIWVLEYMSES